jgi:bacterioferritin
MSEAFQVSRKRTVDLLNEDISREYQAVIAYTIYSQTIKGEPPNTASIV